MYKKIKYTVFYVLSSVLMTVFFNAYIYDELRWRVTGFSIAVFAVFIVVGYIYTLGARSVIKTLTVITLPFSIYCTIAYFNVINNLTSIIFVIFLGFCAALTEYAEYAAVNNPNSIIGAFYEDEYDDLKFPSLSFFISAFLLYIFCSVSIYALTHHTGSVNYILFH